MQLMLYLVAVPLSLFVMCSKILFLVVITCHNLGVVSYVPFVHK